MLKKKNHDAAITQALQTLKLTCQATSHDVEQSYIRLVKKYHPDICRYKNKAWCNSKFIAVHNARTLMRRFFAGTYNPAITSEIDEEKVTVYKEHLNHLKRFYDGWLGDLDF